MGILFVLMIWAVAAVILASAGIVLLGGLTAYFTRGVKRSRRRAIIAATFFPIACLGWAGTIFVLQWAVNADLLHRDPGLGDVSTCPLPNGYQLLMIDGTDQGSIYNPKTQKTKNVVAEQEDAVDGVRVVQVAGRYILGGLNTSVFDPLPTRSPKVDSYFLLDTNTGKRVTFLTYGELHQAAAQLGIHANLQPIEVVYLRYRFTLFDVLIGFLLLVPPLLSGWLLVRWIVRLRKIG